MSDAASPPHRLQHPRVALALGAAALLAATLLSLRLGSYPIAWDALLSALTGGAGGASDVDVGVLLQLRLPRVLAALAVGAGLALAGALMQGVFRNPLADPALLGVSGGAALFAALALVIGSRVAWLGSGLAVSLAAFAGGLLATRLACRIGRGEGAGADTATLLLAGIALQTLAGAGTGLVVFLADDAELRGITFWMLGSLGAASWSQLAVLLPLVGAALLLARRHAAGLDALLLGEAEAGHLGVPVAVLVRRAVLLATLVTGACVAATGIVGFVGLVVPHLVRLVAGPGHRVLLPASALLGALLLLLADTAARTVLPYREIPLGVVTTALGAPFFLWLVARRRHLVEGT